MSTTALEPRIVDGSALAVAGLGKHFTFANRHEIPALWMEFGPDFGSFAGQKGFVAYGVCSNGSKSGFDYMAAFEVGDRSAIDPKFTIKDIPAQKYVVFTHTEHVSKLGDTMHAIWEWFKASDYEANNHGPEMADFFERYDEEFDPQIGIGHTEVWVPVKTKA